jgi:gas vesicle protein
MPHDLLLWTMAVLIALLALAMGIQAWVGITLLLLFKPLSGKVLQLRDETTKLVQNTKGIVKQTSPAIMATSGKAQSLIKTTAVQVSEIRAELKALWAPLRRMRTKTKQFSLRKRSRH